MAYNTKLGVAAANAEAEATVALCNSGTLELYDGTQPATADTAITDQTLGCTLTFDATALSGSAADGIATFDTITADASADAAITPTWGRAWMTDGTTAVMDFTVGLSGTDCIIDAVPLEVGKSVSVVSMTYEANRG